METIGIKAMAIMAIMGTIIKDMEDMAAMITLLTTTITDMVTTTINLVDMASHHAVVVTPTVTSRINGGNPHLQVGM